MASFKHGVLHDSIFFINRREAMTLFESKMRIVRGVNVLAMKDTSAILGSITLNCLLSLACCHLSFIFGFEYIARTVILLIWLFLVRPSSAWHLYHRDSPMNLLDLGGVDLRESSSSRTCPPRTTWGSPEPHISRTAQTTLLQSAPFTALPPTTAGTSFA